MELIEKIDKRRVISWPLTVLFEDFKVIISRRGRGRGGGGGLHILTRDRENNPCQNTYANLSIYWDCNY